MESQSEIIIGFTRTVGDELRLLFDTYQDACEAAQKIDAGSIKRVTVLTSEGEATVWCNYVAWVRVLRYAEAPILAEEG